MHGYYYDPLHGNCLRRIRRIDMYTYTIDGVYGNDEPNTHGAWTAIVRVTEFHEGGALNMSVDFKGKPIKKNRFMTATYDPKSRVVHWHEDGNMWRQLYFSAFMLS